MGGEDEGTKLYVPAAVVSGLDFLMGKVHGGIEHTHWLWPEVGLTREVSRLRSFVSGEPVVFFCCLSRYQCYFDGPMLANEYVSTH